MTDSIRDRAREAQSEHLKQHGGPTDEVMAATEALYDGVDNLSEGQKLLLVREALKRVSGVLDTLVTTNNPGQRAGFGAVAHATAALGAYAVESLREASGNTSTGDSKVDEALDGVRHLLGLFAQSQMSPEQKALSEKIRAKVQERVSAGENFEQAMAEELAAHEDERRAVESVPAASQGREARPDDGMYL